MQAALVLPSLVLLIALFTSAQNQDVNPRFPDPSAARELPESVNNVSPLSMAARKRRDAGSAARSEGFDNSITTGDFDRAIVTRIGNQDMAVCKQPGRIRSVELIALVRV